MNSAKFIRIDKNLFSCRQELQGLFGIGVKITPSKAQKSATTLKSETAPQKATESENGTADVQLTPLELKLKRAREIQLVYEQDKLFERIDNLVKTFDAQLRILNHDKFQLDITLKNADLRHVTLFEELVLLREFEKREDTLAEKVEGKQQEKMDMQTKVCASGSILTRNFYLF